MKAAGYARVSTEEQAREGYGLPAQEQAIRSYCAAQGWELVQIYTDAGRSGKSMRGREALGELLENAHARRFERVVFWRLDRLGRNLRDLLEICDRLETSSVGIVSIQEAIDTGTATGRMIRSVLGALAEFEREVITDRIKAGYAEKARQGELVGPLPLGYRREEAGGVVADPVTSPLIREAFNRYATGEHSLRDMAAWAVEVGLRSSEGNPLDRLTIRKILTNVSYMGQVAYHMRRGGGIVSNGRHPAIVDATLFSHVQEVLKGRQRSFTPHRPFGKEPYPLSGIAVCAYDASPLLGTKASKRAVRYMRCSTAQRRGRDACQQPMVRAEILEAQVGAYVSGMRLPVEYLGAVVQELRQRQDAPDRGEAARLEREIERWRRLFVMGEIDEERYRQETRSIRRRLAEIDQPRQVLDVEQAVHYLRDVGKLWSESSKLQREFVREIFARIVVEDHYVASITPKPAYAPMFVLDRRERFGGEMARVGGVNWLPGQDSNLQPSG